MNYDIKLENTLTLSVIDILSIFSVITTARVRRY